MHATLRVPIISATVVQWTGASPWMDLVQRALTWEAREPGLYVNLFFGFPFADVPDVGMTIQVMTNDNARLAAEAASDVAGFAWRQRKALLTSTRIYVISDGVALAKQAAARGDAPVVLADHSDRSGQRDLAAGGNHRPGYFARVDRDHRRRGNHHQAQGSGGQGRRRVRYGSRWAGGLAFSRRARIRHRGHHHQHCGGLRADLGLRPLRRRQPADPLDLSGADREPFSLGALGIDIKAYDHFAIKSRVHFRRGFDDNGFARTILLVEPPEPFLGTVHLDALPYRNVDLKQFYPYGSPAFLGSVS